MKAFLTTLVVVLSLVITGDAWGEEQGKVFASYFLSNTDNAVRMLKEVEPGDELRAGTYTVKAKLGFKTEKRPVVFETQDLEWKEPETYHTLGWTVKDGVYLWCPGADSGAIEVPLVLKSADKGTLLTDFDELWIEYQELFPDNPSWLSLEMVLTSESLDGNSTVMAVAGEEEQLEGLETLDVSQASWKEKDYSYLARRVLGLSFDSAWRYDQEGQRLIIQRRFHKDLSTIEAMDLVFRSGTVVELESGNSPARGFRVNLQVGFKGRPKPTEVVVWEALPKRVMVINGQQVIRIGLGELVRQRYSEKEKTYLEEVVVFVPGQVKQVVQNRPLEKIVFQALASPARQEEVGDILRLPSRTEVLSRGRKRLKVDMRELVSSVGRDVRLQKANSRVRSSDPDSFAGLRLHRARIVSLVEQEMPTFLRRGEDLSIRWGGPFLSTSGDNVQVEWVLVNAYLPFQNPELSCVKDQAHEEDIDSLAKSQKTPPPLNPLPPGEGEWDFLRGRQDITSVKDNTAWAKETRLGRDSVRPMGTLPIIGRDISVSSDSHPCRWGVENDGLVLEGDGRWVELDWPVRVHVKKSTRFFISISDGDERIARIKLIAMSRSKSKMGLNVPVMPNRAMKLANLEGDVDGMRIRIELYEGPFRLKLREMVFFRPVLLSPAQALDVPLPYWDNTPLTPTDIHASKEAILLGRPGGLHGVLPTAVDQTRTLEWTTIVNQKMGWIHGLLFDFKVPWTAHANRPKWLSLTLKGKQHSVQREISIDRDEGQIYIPLAISDFFGENGMETDEVLREIVWSVDLGNLSAADQNFLPIDLNMHLYGMTLRPFRDEIKPHSLLKINGQELAPTGSDADITREMLDGSSSWLDLGHLSVAVNDETKDDLVQILDHPYLLCDAVMFERTNPLFQREWDSLVKEQRTEPNIGNTSVLPSRLLELGLLVCAIAGSWWGWRQGWWRRIWMRVKGILVMLFDLPWIGPGLRFLSMHRIQFIIWSTVALMLYSLGLMRRAGSGENYCFTFGGIAVVLAWRSITRIARPWLTQRWSALADKVYGGAGAHYIVGFMVILIAVALLLIIKLEPVAEQLAVIGYYMLVVGVVLEAWALRRKRQDGAKDAPDAQVPGEVISNE